MLYWVGDGKGQIHGEGLLCDTNLLYEVVG